MKVGNLQHFDSTVRNQQNYNGSNFPRIAAVFIESQSRSQNILFNETSKKEAYIKEFIILQYFANSYMFIFSAIFTSSMRFFQIPSKVLLEGSARITSDYI
jgi:hypothetical protein